jgi:aldose 1-epimerase
MENTTLEIKSESGLRLLLTNFGARVLEFIVPDKNGRDTNIILRLPGIAPYLNKEDPYYGCMVGRVANRIANGEFSLNGKKYSLPKNHGRHCLHGGENGFSYVTWEIVSHNTNRAVFKYESPDGEEGFPGRVLATVTYELRGQSLILSMHADVSVETPLNLTNHMYFNLENESPNGILDHFLKINADYYVPVDSELIPLGQLAAVEGTPFDFREGKLVLSAISELPQGIDHTFVIRGHDAFTLVPACTLRSRLSGIVLEIFSTQPGIQVYTGNFMQKKHGAIALEPQHFPDSPNQVNFPSVIYSPARPYRHTIKYFISEGNRGPLPFD